MSFSRREHDIASARRLALGLAPRRALAYQRILSSSPYPVVILAVGSRTDAGCAMAPDGYLNRTRQGRSVLKAIRRAIRRFGPGTAFCFSVRLQNRTGLPLSPGIRWRVSINALVRYGPGRGQPAIPLPLARTNDEPFLDQLGKRSERGGLAHVEQAGRFLKTEGELPVVVAVKTATQLQKHLGGRSSQGAPRWALQHWVREGGVLLQLLPAALSAPSRSICHWPPSPWL